MKTLRRTLCTALMALGLATPAVAQEMPPLPQSIRAPGVLRAGVRCDQPPYGFRGPDGGFAGVEVEMAHHHNRVDIEHGPIHFAIREDQLQLTPYEGQH